MLAQLYLAIIIARLVGLEIASRLQNPRPPGVAQPDTNIEANVTRDYILFWYSANNY